MCHISLILLTLALYNNYALLLSGNSSYLFHCLQFILKALKLWHLILKLMKDHTFFPLALDRYLLRSFRFSQYTPDVLKAPYVYSFIALRGNKGGNDKLIYSYKTKICIEKYLCSTATGTVGSLTTHCSPKSKK